MKKIIVGLVAATAVAAPIAATAGPAAAADAPTCTPSKAVAAVKEVSHTEYQWAALVAKPTLHWEYKWTASTKNPTTDLKHVWVKSLDLSKKGLPQITRTVVDVEAVDAKDAVTCEVTLPERFEGEGTESVVVPYTEHVDTFLYGVPGHPETEAITQDTTVTVYMVDQFWVGYTPHNGYVATNKGQWHVDFNYLTGVDSVVKFSKHDGKHINLPDVFDIEHTEYSEGTYWATKVKVLVVNDTNADQEFRIRYADVQDGNRVWVQGTRFTDGLPNNVVPANSSRPFEIEVWHNVVSGADVPDDLTLDFGFELA